MCYIDFQFRLRTLISLSGHEYFSGHWSNWKMTILTYTQDDILKLRPAKIESKLLENMFKPLHEAGLCKLGWQLSKICVTSVTNS